MFKYLVIAHDNVRPYASGVKSGTGTESGGRVLKFKRVYLMTAGMLLAPEAEQKAQEPVKPVPEQPPTSKRDALR